MHSFYRIPIPFIDIDECSSSNNGGCLQICTNLEGSHVCSCMDGYELGGDGRDCEDIDECSASPCSHACVNLPGGFRCECPEGYRLDSDGVLCTGIMN